MQLIGIIGDSIAHGFYDEENLGWPARLGQMLLQKQPGAYIFNNMAQSGDNIADAANRAVHEVLSRHFDIIIVSLGINDIRRRKNSDLALDFSLGARLMYWQRLLDTLALTKAKIIITDLLPVIENRYSAEATLVRYNQDVEEYNAMLQKLCSERGITFWSRYAEWKNRDLEKLYADATHPNAAGQQLIAEEFLARWQDL